MSEYYDKKDQLQKIRKMLIPSEILYAVYDMKGVGTGFVGITDLRLIFMDQAFIRKSKSMVSLPYSKITALGTEEGSNLIMASVLGTSKLMVVAGTWKWEFEFRSNDKATKAYQLILQNMLQTEARSM